MYRVQHGIVWSMLCLQVVEYLHGSEACNRPIPFADLCYSSWISISHRDQLHLRRVLLSSFLIRRIGYWLRFYSTWTGYLQYWQTQILLVYLCSTKHWNKQLEACKPSRLIRMWISSEELWTKICSTLTTAVCENCPKIHPNSFYFFYMSSVILKNCRGILHWDLFVLFQGYSRLILIVSADPWLLVVMRLAKSFCSFSYLRQRPIFFWNLDFQILLLNPSLCFLFSRCFCGSLFLAYQGKMLLECYLLRRDLHSWTDHCWSLGLCSELNGQQHIVSQLI